MAAPSPPPVLPVRYSCGMSRSPNAHSDVKFLSGEVHGRPCGFGTWASFPAGANLDALAAHQRPIAVRAALCAGGAPLFDGADQGSPRCRGRDAELLAARPEATVHGRPGAQ